MTTQHMHPTDAHVTHGPHFTAGRWYVVIALLLPLAAIAALTWLGAAAMVEQARADARRALAAQADVLAARVHVELRRTLDMLEAAAVHGWTDASSLPCLTNSDDFVIYATDDPPSAHQRYQVFRQARAGDWAIVVNTTPGQSSLIMAAVDNPGEPRNVALAEISPDALLTTLSRPAGDYSIMLFDRYDTPLGSNEAEYELWAEDAPGNPRLLKFMRPVEDFSLGVGVARVLPSDLELVLDHGRPVLIGGAVCAVLLTGLTLWLTSVVRRRLAAIERKRKIAMEEMEHVQKLSSIGRLAAGVAHEINNPLAIISEKAGLMKDLANAAAKDFPKAQRFMQLSDSVLSAVDRCRAVTHRLLGFARRMEVRTMELNLNEVLREVLGFLEREALFRNITLQQDFADNLPSVESDRGQLQQVFLNLLNNAMAAVKDEVGRIRIATRLNTNGVVVEIEDNGIGMSREVMAHLFEPFFSTKGEKGTGLGLSITYGIVNRLGGRIEVASEQGKGTTFTVRLPLHPPAAAHGADRNAL